MINNKNILVAIIHFILILFSKSVFSLTCNVPDVINYPSIQSAIDANCDVILVEPGRYYENLVISNKSVSINSTSGPNDTIIDGSNSATGASVVQISGFNSSGVIRGFTITGGNVPDGPGGGVYISQAARPTIDNCIISANSAMAGGGLAAYHGTQAKILNTVISNNRATGDALSGLPIDCPSSTNDEVLDGGGGVYTGCASFMQISQSEITANWTAGSGGGMRSVNSIVSFSLGDISNNIAVDSGGAVKSDKGILVMINDVLTKNTSGNVGGVLHADPDRHTLINSTVADNVSSMGGGYTVTSSNSGYIQIMNSIIYHNSDYPVFSTANDCSVVSYSNIEGRKTGDVKGFRNLNTDPLFVDAVNNDYRLTARSKMIDAGTAVYQLPTCLESIVAPAADKDGVLRPQGDDFDIGAYEYQDL